MKEAVLPENVTQDGWDQFLLLFPVLFLMVTALEVALSAATTIVIDPHIVSCLSPRSFSGANSVYYSPGVA